MAWAGRVRGAGAIGPGEPDALAGQGVEAGRLRPGVAVAAEAVGPRGVEGDEEDVERVRGGPAVRPVPGRSDEKTKAGQKGQNGEAGGDDEDPSDGLCSGAGLSGSSSWDPLQNKGIPGNSQEKSPPPARGGRALVRCFRSGNWSLRRRA